jgi:formate-dependent nitrite reductase cytochrome c552 subunit
LDNENSNTFKRKGCHSAVQAFTALLKEDSSIIEANRLLSEDQAYQLATETKACQSASVKGFLPYDQLFEAVIVLWPTAA